MKIAFLGSRGIPARYSGFETFYEELATRLVKRGHEVTVYNRTHIAKDVTREYKGVRIVRLPCVRTKHLETISHTLLSTVHATFQKYDVVYYCIVGNSPLVWLPRITGARTILNVDGSDWARQKWNAFARWYQHRCERLAVTTANVLVADAHGVQRKYEELYHADSVFVPYGANVRHDERLDALQKWSLEPDGYFLFAGRLVPENAAHLLISAFKDIETAKKLVIVGDATYSEDYKRQLRAIADDRVVFTGYAFGADYAQLSSHCYLYVQPSGIDGTRPAILDQLGFGNCVLVRNTEVNMEVVADCGCSYNGGSPDDLAKMLKQLLAEAETVQQFRNKASSRIDGYYNWTWITDFYEDLFGKLMRNAGLISFDEYLAERQRPTAS
jgi:glycosyltransferase involved in cell wall biosynthesis